MFSLYHLNNKYTKAVLFWWATRISNGNYRSSIALNRVYYANNTNGRKFNDNYKLYTIKRLTTIFTNLHLIIY